MPSGHPGVPQVLKGPQYPLVAVPVDTPGKGSWLTMYGNGSSVLEFFPIILSRVGAVQGLVPLLPMTVSCVTFHVLAMQGHILNMQHDGITSLRINCAHFCSAVSSSGRNERHFFFLLLPRRSRVLCPGYLDFSCLRGAFLPFCPTVGGSAGGGTRSAGTMRALWVKVKGDTVGEGWSLGGQRRVRYWCEGPYHSALTAGQPLDWAGLGSQSQWGYARWNHSAGQMVVDCTHGTKVM